MDTAYQRFDTEKLTLIEYPFYPNKNLLFFFAEPDSAPTRLSLRFLN